MVDTLFNVTPALPRKKIINGICSVTNCFNWWPRAESNHRHKDFQSSALPTELLGLFDSARQSIGAPGRIRTHDPLVRSQVLYPTELRALETIYCYQTVVTSREIIAD